MSSSATRVLQHYTSGLGIRSQVDPPQIPVIDQFHHRARHEKLYAQPLLSEPPSNQPSLHRKTLRHSVDPIIERIRRPRRRIQIRRRQTPLRIRRPRRTHILSILTSKPIQQRARLQREIVHCGFAERRELIAGEGRVEEGAGCGVGVGCEELRGTEATEAMVGAILAGDAGEWEGGGEGFGAEAGVGTDVGV